MGGEAMSGEATSSEVAREAIATATDAATAKAPVGSLFGLPSFGVSLSTRLALFYWASFTIYGISMPYLNVWFKHRGLSINEIAIVSAVAPLVRMLCGPVVTFFADRWNAHARLLAIASWMGLLAWIVLSMATSFWSAVAGMVLVAMTGAALNPLIDTIAMTGVRTHGVDYGRVRAWGSISFIVAAVVSGMVVDWRGIDMAMLLLVLAAASTALTSLLAPVYADGDPSAQRKPMKVADAIALVRHPVMLLFLISAGAVQGSHAVLNVFSVLHWQALGLSNWWCGVLWAVGVTAEIILFLVAGRWFPRLGPLALMGLGGATAIVRWAIMSVDPPLGVLIPLQVAHGLTFGASHLGAINFLARAIPEHQAGTAQGLYSLMTGGLVMALSTQVAGIAYAVAGGRAYAAMAVIAAVSLAATFLLYKSWDGERLASGRKGVACDRRI